jgi:hypothetical protein
LELPWVEFNESTEAYSDIQAIRFVMRRLAKRYGLVRVFSKDAVAAKVEKEDR